MAAPLIFDREVSLLKMKSLCNKIMPPCSKCPYKLGLVHTVVNSCPQCKENGYQTYDRFTKPGIRAFEQERDNHD